MIVSGCLFVVGFGSVTAMAVAWLEFARPGAGGLLRGEERVLRALIEALVATVPWGGSVPVDAAVADVADHLRAALGLPRAALRWVFFAFDFLPVLMGESCRRFHRLGVDRRLRVLRQASRARNVPVRTLVESACLAVLFSLVGRVEFLSACGVDRAAGVAEARTRRARELAGSPP